MARFKFLFIAVVVASAVAAACGSSESVLEAPLERTTVTMADGPAVVPIAVAVADRLDPSVGPTLAGQAISQFGIDLFAAVRAENPGANVSVSPASVATALAMLEPGTVGDAQEQLRALLGISDVRAFHASMNALETDLETRQPEAFPGQEAGEVEVRFANAAFLQSGQPFKPTYLEAIGSNYGPVLREADFAADPDAVARGINEFVAEETEQRITDLIGEGVITPDTILALVNALYLRASWLNEFDSGATVDATFTTGAGEEVTVKMMQGTASSSAKGENWVGATKQLTAGLYVQFILPDKGSYEDVAANLPAVFDELESKQVRDGPLSLPKLETRFNVGLNQALQSLGLVAPYQSGGLLGIIDDPRVVVDEVIHETFVAMDEQGVEAAGATVVLVRATSGGGPTPVTVVLDRPFVYRIVDSVSGATLFIGQLTDPTAG